ncbi:MAG: hypothetical protein JWQ42_4337 [Edaphobacter sp.]|nr:hypothetical protein [Edaphobacter sp.]
MKAFILRMIVVALLLPNPILTAAIHHQASPDSKTQTTATYPPVPSTEGASVFQQNCSRCHRPPMSVSPRVTGAVIMHMRVRARLSQEDEQLLLKYMAP